MKEGDSVRIVGKPSLPYGLPEEYSKLIWTVSWYDGWSVYLWIACEIDEFKIHEKHITQATALDMMAEV